MNELANLKEINKLEVNNIVQYILKEETFEFEKDILSKMESFENKYNKLFLKSKKEYYISKPLNMNSKFRIEIKEWMLDRLIAMDLYDSLNKYFFLNIIDFHDKIS